ncbi:hypothetical protein MASR2M70_05650 [Bacillota bacterium]
MSINADTELLELNEHEKELLKRFLDDIKSLPRGGLHAKIIRGRECCYHYIPSNAPGEAGKRVHLGKDDAELLSGLCKRKFLVMSIKDLQKFIRHRERYLKNCGAYDPNTIMSRLPKSCANVCKLPVLKSQNGVAAALLGESIQSTFHADQLIYSTPNGIKVRSKSELIIATELELSYVPYHYEAALTLEGQNYYPDFTILSPKNNRIIYWEHFGKPDDPVYARSMNEKLSVYRRNKIVPFYNLIETYEMPGIPFDANLIRRIIKSMLIP